MGKLKSIIKDGTKLITFGSITATLSACSAYVVPTVAVVNPIAGAIVGGAIAIASTITAGAVCSSCVDPYVDKVVDSVDDAIKQTKEDIQNNTEDIKIAKEFEEIFDKEGEEKAKAFLESKKFIKEDIDKFVKDYIDRKNKKKKGSRG